jgi:GNAT superfamily N-acetyltransferase
MAHQTELDDFEFDWDWVEHAELVDGTPVRLRLVSPKHREKLAEGFEKLSLESRHRRFFSTRSRLSESDLDYLTDVDQLHHVALGAELDGGTRDGEGVGVARFIRLGDASTTAEAAFTVIDEFQGLGLGRILFDRLAAAGRERGVQTFRATHFRDNESMRKLLLGGAQAPQTVESDHTVVTVDIALDDRDD